MTRTGILGIRLNHPAQFVVLAFGTAISFGTLILMLPFASASGEGAPALTALFTSTSAVCVTGLITVDTATYWSGFGQAVVLALIQIGGFGIMTIASLAAIFISHKLGLRSRLMARAETGALDLGDVRKVLGGVARYTLALEAIATLCLTVRFLVSYDETPLRALWLGSFHAISAFNNAGFALFSDNLMGFLRDPFVLLVIAFTVIAGGLGFPVMLDLSDHRRHWRRWSLHTKLTLAVTAVLLIGGTVVIALFEWANAATLGPLDTQQSLVASFFHSVMPRTAGFNAIDMGQVTESTLLVTVLLMFIGGGAASTAGGIKVSTVAVIALMVWAELRGDPDVSTYGRRVPPGAQRQALSVVMIGLSALFTGNLLLIGLSEMGIADTLFEAASAFGTVGLSTGITGLVPDPAQLVLVVLMFIGRVGPLTLGTALILRERRLLYRFPEERPIIG